MWTVPYVSVAIRKPCNPDVEALKDRTPGVVINRVTLATDGSLIKTAL